MCGGPTTRPVIVFAQQTKAGIGTSFTTVWAVEGASEPISLFASYKVQLQMDGIPLVATAQSLVANTNIKFGTVTLIVRDLAGEGKLTAGDSFLVYGMTTDHDWKFSLIWSADANEIASKSWSTP